MSSILPISSNTVHLLSSAQVITSVYAVVKELVENALDAKATSIEVKLERYGLDLIEVRDNGTGIKSEDVHYMAMPHFTSKLHEFSDIHSLLTYGFRGEALTSIAAVSDMSVTTCTESDEVAFTYTINHAGEVVGTKPGHASQGTVVSVKNLFQTIPVRKQCYKNDKRCREELKKVEDLLLAFGIAHPGVRFVLKHNRSVIWQKVSADPKANLTLVLGSHIFQQLSPVNYQCFNPMVKINAHLPKPNADNVSLVSRSTSDRMFVLVNRRPVYIKPVIKLVRRLYIEAFPSQSGRFPIAVVRIDVPPGDYDVNLDPNKSQVLLHHLDFILTTLESLITQFYGPSKVANAPQQAATKKQQPTSTSENKCSTSQQTLKNATCSSSKKAAASPTKASEDMVSNEDMSSSHFDDPAIVASSSASSKTPNRVCSDVDQLSSRQDQDEEKIETFELLDISEFEQDFDDDLSDCTVDREVKHHQTAARENGIDSVSPLTQVTLSQWSRGDINKDMQPVKILQPTTITSTTDTAATPKQSKLVNRGPSPIFDMINYKPVKRKADSSPPGQQIKRQKQLPTMLKKLVHRQQEEEGQSNVVPLTCTKTVVRVEMEKIASRLSSIQEQQSASTSNSAPKKSSATTCSVIGYCDPPGVWLILVGNNITYFHRTELNLETPSAVSRDADLELIHNILSSSRSNEEDFKCYFHHLCTI